MKRGLSEILRETAITDRVWRDIVSISPLLALDGASPAKDEVEKAVWEPVTETDICGNALKEELGNAVHR